MASALDLAGSPGEGEYLTMACLFGDVGGIGDIAGRVGAILIFPGDEGSPFVRVPNVFAIPGLCSLSLTLAGVMDKIHSLKTGFGVVLTFGCVKMLLVHSPWKIDTHLSLCVIDRVLAD